MAIDIVDIPCDLGLNILCTIGVSKCVLRLVKVLTGGTDTNNHDCLAIASKGELEQPSQFGVAVGYMVLLPRVAECIDATS